MAICTPTLATLLSEALCAAGSYLPTKSSSFMRSGSNRVAWNRPSARPDPNDVCFWHKADITTRSTNVRFWG